MISYLGTTYLIKTEGDGILSAGTVCTVTAGTEMEGWLECDGSVYDPEQYPELHKMLQGRRAVFAKKTLLQKLLRRPGKFLGHESYGIFGTNRLPDFRGRIVR